MRPDETTTEEKSSRSYWGFVLWPFVILVLYVLSAGPACLMYRKGIIGRNVMIVWTPLARVVEATPLRKPFYMYLDLWCLGRYASTGSDHAAKTEP